MQSTTISAITVTVAALPVIWLFYYWRLINQDVYCGSFECRRAAQDILQDLHPRYQSIDPCVNFYNLTCGGFEEANNKPSQHEYVNQLTLIQRRVSNNLNQILEQEPHSIPLTDRDIFTKMRSSYTSCMDLKTLQHLGFEPLEDLVERIKLLSVFNSSKPPVLQNLQQPIQLSPTISSPDPFTQTFLFLVQSGVITLFEFAIMPDDKAPDTQIVNIFPVYVVGLPAPSYYSDIRTIKMYKDAMQQVLTHFYQCDKIEQPDLQHTLCGAPTKLSDGIIALETDIAGTVPPFGELLDPEKTYNKMSFDEIKRMLPELSIPTLIKELGQNTSTSEFVIVRSPVFLQRLSKIMSHTPPNILRAFFVWKAIQEYASRIEDPKLEPLKRFQRELNGRPTAATSERWKQCVQEVGQEVPWILSKFYIQDNFPGKAKEFGSKIIDDVREAFAALLPNAAWMAHEDRDVAQKKVQSLAQKVGYPTKNPDVLSSPSLSSYYKALDIRNNTYFENKLRTAAFNAHLEWRKLGKPTQHEDFGMSPLTVTAWYTTNRNEIGFPAAFLQPPVLFDVSIPSYLSYGALGSVSGHEISHGFDPSGSKYDYDGKFRKWWSNSTREAFERKATCFENQYFNYTIPKSHEKYRVNGSLTLGENVADAGGVHAAFSAWRKHEKGHPAPLLKGLEYFTKDQLFFVAYGRFWCSNGESEELYRRMLMNAHAPEEVRLVGTMENSREFKEAFGCTEQKPQCELW